MGPLPTECHIYGENGKYDQSQNITKRHHTDIYIWSTDVVTYNEPDREIKEDSTENGEEDCKNYVGQKVSNSEIREKTGNKKVEIEHCRAYRWWHTQLA